MRGIGLMACLMVLAACPRPVVLDPSSSNGSPPVLGSRALREPCEQHADCLSNACVEGNCCEERCLPSQTCWSTRAPGRCVDREVGDHCDSTNPEACGGLPCVEGVCCEKACDVQGQPTLSCALPRNPGACTTRILGDPCNVDAGQACPSGHCVDGVCCESECRSCMECNAPGHAGHCVDVSDNTDPQHECNGQCLACFGGMCLPALPNTNPHGTNGGCPGELVCGLGGTCGSALGAPCPFPAGDGGANTCAAGTCEPLGPGGAGICTSLTIERIAGPAFNSNAQERNIIAMSAHDPAHPVLLIHETEYDPSDPMVTNDAQVHFARLGDDGWSTAVVVPHRAWSGTYALLGYGNRALMVMGPRTSNTRVTDRVIAEWLGPDGKTGGTEILWEDPRYPVLCGATLVSAPDAIYAVLALMTPTTLFCEDVEGPFRIRVLKRSFSSGQWQDVTPGQGLPESRGLLGAAMVGDQLVVLDRQTMDGPVRAFLPLRGADAYPLVVPPACGDGFEPRLAQNITSSAPAHPGWLRLNGLCQDHYTVYQGTARVDETGVHWDVTLAPTPTSGDWVLSALGPTNETDTNWVFLAKTDSIKLASLLQTDGGTTLGTPSPVYQSQSGNGTIANPRLAALDGVYYVSLAEAQDFVFVGVDLEGNLTARTRAFPHDVVLLKVRIGR